MFIYRTRPGQNRHYSMLVARAAEATSSVAVVRVLGFAVRLPGLLLQTGAIQLGPGLGQNAYRWLGDGQWGFD